MKTGIVDLEAAPLCFGVWLSVGRNKKIQIALAS